MSENTLLQPYSEFAARDLAQQLHEVVGRNVSQLETRNLPGVVARYGHDIAEAQASVEKGAREHVAGILGHFAVVGPQGDVIGAASLDANLVLRKLHLPLFAGVGRRTPFVATKYAKATPNVHAWVDEDEDVLSDVYSNLVTVSRQTGYPYPGRTRPVRLRRSARNSSTWTLEPVRSPGDVHKAIAMGGLERVANGRFDDGEASWRVPLEGTLYAEFEDKWRPPFDRLDELRDGEEVSFEAWLRGTTSSPQY